MELERKDKNCYHGGTGFIGQELVRELIDEFVYLALLSRDENKVNFNVDKRREIFIGDLCDKHSLEAFIKDSTVIINLAGEYIDQDLMINSNYMASKTYMKLLKNIQCHILYMSVVLAYMGDLRQDLSMKIQNF